MKYTARGTVINHFWINYPKQIYSSALMLRNTMPGASSLFCITHPSVISSVVNNTKKLRAEGQSLSQHEQRGAVLIWGGG